MLLSNINYELSVRLGDPIDQETGDGLVFTNTERLKYITRAYSKLTRLLKILMRDYQPEFNKTREVKNYSMVGHEGDVATYVSQKEIDPVSEISEVFVHYKLKGDSVTKIKPAAYMEPTKYLSNKYNVNDIKGTSFEDGKFKYTIMSNIASSNPILYLLPLIDYNSGTYYKEIELLYNPDLLSLNWESSLPITNQYVDLLIDLAAIQGMQDIGRADKAQLIERSLSSEWQILGQYGSYMKQTEGVKE